MLYGIIFFLLVAVIVVGAFAAVLVVKLRNADTIDEISEQFGELQTEHTKLQAEKAAIEEAAVGYLADLKAARAENNELAAALEKALATGKSQGTSPASPWESVIPVGILNANATNKFTCEPFRRADGSSAFHVNSDQARLQEDCATEPGTGIRYYYTGTGEHYYCVALGGAFGNEIGHAFEVTLRNGYVFPVITSDFRHPVDPEHEIYDVLGVDMAHDYGDYFELLQGEDGHYYLGDRLKNYDDEDVLAVIEFVVDIRLIPHIVRESGTFTALAAFGGLHGPGGNIASIRDLGRVWKP